MQFDEENPYDVHCITAAIARAAARRRSVRRIRSPACAWRTSTDAGCRSRPTTSWRTRRSSSCVAGRATDDGDVDILMIEAGGFEHTMAAHRRRRDAADGGGPRRRSRGREADHQAARATCSSSSQRRSRSPSARGSRCATTGRRHRPRNDASPGPLGDALAIARRPTATRRSTRSASTSWRRSVPEFDVERVTRRSRLRCVRSRRTSSASGSSTKASGSTDAGRRICVQLYAEVGLLSRAHGTGLFERGETQALSVATLAMPRMEQFVGVDELLDKTKRYMHHYQFPPFSTGEAYPMRGPRRREIGHGALAEKAVLAGRSRARTSSRTRSAWCPRCSSRTARRRWRRSAVRPSR